MKKLLLTVLMLTCAFFSFAQKTDTLKSAIQKNAEAIGHGGNNELKINLLYTVLGRPEITYERLIADNMGLGISVFVNLDNREDYNEMYKFAVTPHYRIYFGAKKASGFFIEGDASLTTIRTDYNDYHYLSSASMPTGYNYANTETNRTHFGLGAAAGGKFLTRNGFLGEAYFGVNRLLSKRGNGGVSSRIGITIGKRF